MRTKALLGLAALAAGAMTAAAQSSVYSLNVVGYYNVTVPAGKYAMVANQLVGTNYTVASVLAGVPAGTTVMKWTGTIFSPNTLDPDFGWDDPEMTLGPGEAAFVKNNGANPFTITFVGEVNQATNALTFTDSVYKMASVFTPQAGKITTDFGFPAASGDTVMQWTGSIYSPYVYDPDFGWDPEPTLAVGEGFFVKAKGTKTWTRSFTVPQ